MAKKIARPPIDFKYNITEYWNILKNYKMLIALLAVTTLLIEASFLLDKFIFKEVIDRGTEFLAGAITQQAYLAVLYTMLLVFVALTIVRPILKWVQLHFQFVLSTGSIYDLKRKMFNHLIRLSHSFHTTNKTGSIISRLIRGGWAIDGLNDVMIFNFLPLILQTIMLGIALALFDVTSAIVVLTVIVVFAAYSYMINKWQEHANIKSNNQEDLEKGIISDVFTNIDSIKYFGKEKQIQEKYEKVGRKTSSIFLWHWNHFRWLTLGHAFILMVGTFFIVYFPLQRMLHSEITIGTLVFIYTSYGNIIGPLFGFDHGLRQFYKAMADFESLFQYYKVENDIKDPKVPKRLEVKSGEIQFNHVYFKYKKKYILNDFNLDIKPNQKVAFVGSSGAGKSTIIKLLYRLYDLDKGNILIDDVDIKDVNQESLRGQLSIVPQECVLFDDTLYNNILFSSKGSSRAQVMQAIRFAQLDKAVVDFPKREQTVVGERGVKLSGGEKQRVSIARALLADKQILVLDEATSALDSETEHEIQKDLFRLMEGRTAIIIAHRLSTIMRADRIIVLDKGHIVQDGTHLELIRQDGIYKKLWNLQKGGYIK